jgi:catechol 2,3-dioxygenase-like lactoylglutathione lyase family enzyme
MTSRLLSLLVAILFLSPLACSGGDSMNKKPEFVAFSSVTVGVADMDVAYALWVDAFGMDVVLDRKGPDAGIAGLWGISPDEISRQLLLNTNGSRYGMLHLVEFKNPQAPVRLNAEVFDLVPKNLDIYVRDMPERIAELAAAGHTFRNEKYSEATAPDGTKFREMHMPSHDSINVVLLEVMGSEKPLSDKGYGSIGPLIYIVPDAGVEKAFLSSIFEFDKLNDNLLSGPEIEKMVGLPPGAGLDVSIWGRHDQPLGELEIVDYQGVTGRNLFPAAVAPATGILHVSFRLDNVDSLLQRLRDASISFEQHASVESILGSGRVIVFKSPAGLRVEVHEVIELP